MKCGLDSKQLCKLFKPMQTCLRLKFLNLSENNFNKSEEGSNLLAETLRNLDYLEIIGLNNCMIGSEGIKKILDALKNKSNLTEIYIAFNDITEAFSTYFNNEYAKYFIPLKALSLANNSIKEKGAENLSYFLRNKLNIQYLRIGGNKIKAKGLEFIINSLKGKGKLKDLDVGNNDLQDEGAKIVENYLDQNNKTLEYLNIMKNEISEERIIAILSILKKQPIQCKINVFGNKAKDENIQQFFTSSRHPPSKNPGIPPPQQYI